MTPALQAPPMLAVGLEGMWGLILAAVMLPALTVLRGTDGLPLDSLTNAFSEIAANSKLAFFVALSVVTVAFFNAFGQSITRRLSGAGRSTIDACRMLSVWLYTLLVGWENFHPLQVFGFILLISGTLLYNGVISMPCLAEPGGRRSHGSKEPLLGGMGSPSSDEQRTAQTPPDCSESEEVAAVDEEIGKCGP